MNEATVRVFLASKNYTDGLKPLRLEFYFKDNRRYTKTLCKLLPDQWKNNKVVKHPNAIKLNIMIQDELIKASEYILDCSRAGVVVDPVSYFSSQKLTLLTELIKNEAEERINDGKFLTGKKYQHTASKVAKFNAKSTLNINHDWADKYVAFWLNQGNIINTIRNDIRLIKSVLSKAIRRGLITANPLDGYKLKYQETTKEKLTIDEIQLFETANVEGADKVAVEVFLFSLYHWGMRAHDVITLRKDQIIKGRIFYTSHKAKKRHEVDMIYKPSEYPGEYLFPYMGTFNPIQSQWMVKISNVNYKINKRLKRIAKELGINKKVTMHTARHSFASIADEKGLSLNDIRELLGHSNVSTTANYIKSIQKSDVLNEKVKGLFN